MIAQTPGPWRTAVVEVPTPRGPRFRGVCYVGPDGRVPWRTGLPRGAEPVYTSRLHVSPLNAGEQARTRTIAANLAAAGRRRSVTPTSEARNRHESPDPAWILPLTPPPGVGIVTPSCTDRTDVLAVPIRTGQGLRIGGEASLCWHCGPGGSVYHPDDGYSMADVRREADRLPFVTGYDPADLTPAVLAEFERDLRAALDRPAAGSGVVTTVPLPESFVVQVLAVEPPPVATFTARPDGTCTACGRPESDHDRRYDLPDAPAYCLVQPSTVAVLRAVMLSGEPCRVACEPRMAAEIAERLAAEGQPCYADVESWQIL